MSIWFSYCTFFAHHSNDRPNLRYINAWGLDRMLEGGQHFLQNDTDSWHACKQESPSLFSIHITCSIGAFWVLCWPWYLIGLRFLGSLFVESTGIKTGESNSPRGCNAPDWHRLGLWRGEGRPKEVDFPGSESETFPARTCSSWCSKCFGVQGVLNQCVFHLVWQSLSVMCLTSSLCMGKPIKIIFSYPARSYE